MSSTHCPPKAPSLALYNKIVLVANAERGEGLPIPLACVCVWGGSREEGRMQKREGCVPHGFKGSPRTVVAAWWVTTWALEQYSLTSVPSSASY